MLELSFKPYKRKLKTPIKMSRGVISERLGVVIRIGDDFAEALIMDYFGTETLEQSLGFLKSLPKQIDKNIIGNLPYYSTHYSTMSAIESVFISKDLNFVRPNMQLTKLLPAGDLAVLKIKEYYSLGFRSFKWKIGIYENEKEVLEQLLNYKDIKIRLDANAGLSLNKAKKWLEFCEGRAIEFIEQPLAINKFNEMLSLSKEFKTKIALDESVSRFEDLSKVEDWDGYVVVKPLRLGSYQEFLEWREKSDMKIVYSSALESTFGESFGLKMAFSDNKNNFSLGYGVADFFVDKSMSLVQPKPVVEQSLVNNSNLSLESLWQKL